MQKMGVRSFTIKCVSLHPNFRNTQEKWQLIEHLQC